jgi:DNA-binding PadR family transcriptional regulator
MSNRKQTETTLSNLELFLLAWIGRDATTLYRLQTEADVSSGASLPGLRNLERLGFVEMRRNKAGTKMYWATELGRRHLSAYWFKAMTPTHDMRSIKRNAWVAILSEHADSAVAYLMEAAAAKEGLADGGQRSIQFRKPRSKDLAGYFEVALAKADLKLQQSEAETLRNLSIDLDEHLR